MLNNLILSNIRKSLSVINQRGLRLLFNPDDPAELHLLPSFDRVDGRIRCAQADYFGFYALRSALRGLELSTNFLVAGQQTLSNGLHGPAVVSLYTAAYHGVGSLLALSGRVWIEPMANEHSLSTDVPPIIAGLLTRHNNWVFEGRGRSHSDRWKDLRPILLNASPPPYFQDLFQYFFRGRYKSKTPLKSYLKAVGSANPLPVGEPFSLREKVDEFLQMIAESRHDALYRGFGSDPLAYEAAINRELVTENHLTSQARAFEKFTRGVVDEVSAKLGNLIGDLNLSEAVKAALFLSVRFPWFDSPRHDLIQPPELAVRLKRLSDSIQS